MKGVIVLLGIFGLALAAIHDPEFSAYMTKHSKSYGKEEYSVRRAAFHQSKRRIESLNAQNTGAYFALNKFSDLFPEEFAKLYKGYKPNKNANVPVLSGSTVSSVDIPQSLDWRSTKGVVTPVKNQGQCGSCWAFSATEGVESAWFLSKKKEVVLAPQQIVDCDTTDAGCDGGDLPTAFAYIKSSGMETEKDYPYTSGESGSAGDCQYNGHDTVAHISGFAYATQSGNETSMQEAMIPHGPLSICVDAETWQDYSGGIIKHDCGDSLDHCVQLVGWNTAGGTPYWIVRNSWGSDWGISGYIYVERNHDLCGIADEATYVII